MNPILRLAAITFTLFLAATPAHAGQLALEFQGVAAGPSSIGGTSLDGDSFTIQADFDPTSGTNFGQGFVQYVPTSIDINVGGTSYTVTDLSNYAVFLLDATNQAEPGLYSPELVMFLSSNTVTGFAPRYTTSSSAFSAQDPSPTVFSGFSAIYGGGLETFSTAAGPLVLVYAGNAGVDASINSVPEPSSLVLCGIGGSIGLVVAWRRRKRAA
jgi:PEP-CTERM motif